jgi:triosephosphate isomerase (TIM)
VVLAPPATLLAALAHECEGSRVHLAAQNIHHEAGGAFTGDISAGMVREAGCAYVIVGHSERRQFAHETDALVLQKAMRAIEHELVPIVCVGESLAEREAGRALSVVLGQVKAALPALKARECVVAYEPIWAIGTGKTAGPVEAEEVHKAIRDYLRTELSDLSELIRLLYGGSVKKDNAAALLACPNVDGALVGGASLDAAAFGAICHAASMVTGEA